MAQSTVSGKAGDGVDFQSISVADLLAFYERRGYGVSVGRGERPAVLVIDFSIAFTRGMSTFPTTGYDDQVAATARLLAAARGRVPVYFTTLAYEPHMRDAGLWAVKIPWLAALQTSAPEVAIDERLGALPGEPVIVKKYASSFFETELDAMLRKDGVDTLIIAGCTTSCCVRATTIDAMQRGYRPLVAAEAVGDLNPALHALHLADLRARYADVVPVDDLIAYVGSIGRRGGSTGRG